MSNANVKSIDALVQFRGQLNLFGAECHQALSEVRVQIDRFVDWLKHDQLKHWKHEIRVREDRVAEAKADLHRCLAATIDPHRTPSCYQEKKILESAKRRLEEAEAKLAAVRRWIPIVEQAVMDFHARSEGLATFLAAGVPAANAELTKSIQRLTEYLELVAPKLTSNPTGPTKTGSVSMRPQVTEAQ